MKRNVADELEAAEPAVKDLILTLQTTLETLGQLLLHTPPPQTSQPPEPEV